MQLGYAGLALIKSFEQCRLTAYLDGGGVPTIGWGHTGSDVFMGQTCTQAQADTWLNDDVQTSVLGVIKCLDVAVSQNQFDALVCFAFNVGVKELGGSTLLSQLNMGHTLLASDEFVKWDHIHGVPSLGLLRRRQAEQALFLTP